MSALSKEDVIRIGGETFNKIWVRMNAEHLAKFADMAFANLVAEKERLRSISAENLDKLQEWQNACLEAERKLLDAISENERFREQIKCGHSMELDALARERDELLVENERLKLFQESALKVCAQLDEVVCALPLDYLDPPDGGDVSLGEQVSRMYSEVKNLRHECAQSRTDLAAAQAKIDSLMLEYCPDEMTPEQIENWGKHQKAVSDQTNLPLQLSP